MSDAEVAARKSALGPGRWWRIDTVRQKVLDRRYVQLGGPLPGERDRVDVVQSRRPVGEDPGAYKRCDRKPLLLSVLLSERRYVPLEDEREVPTRDVTDPAPPAPASPATDGRLEQPVTRAEFEAAINDLVNRVDAAEASGRHLRSSVIAIGHWAKKLVGELLKLSIGVSSLPQLAVRDPVETNGRAAPKGAATATK